MGAVGIGAALSQTPAAAAMNCANNNTCRWTQMQNGNWQPNSNMNPNCNPCVKWSYGARDYLPYWNGWTGTGAWEEHDTDWAMNSWSQLPYDTPTFYKMCNGCATPLVTYGYTSMGATGPCGLTTPSYDSAGYLTQITIDLNFDKNNFDGPIPGNYSPNDSCDAKNALLHETGHAFGEGHSSFSTDVMYASNTDRYAIDQDAQNMLGIVYGSWEGGCSSNCGQAGTDGPPLPVVVHPMTPGELETALIDKATAAKSAVLALEQDWGSTATTVERKATCPTAAACAP
jgi:hypothetical protein